MNWAFSSMDGLRPKVPVQREVEQIPMLLRVYYTGGRRAEQCPVDYCAHSAGGRRESNFGVLREDYQGTGKETGPSCLQSLWRLFSNFELNSPLRYLVLLPDPGGQAGGPG